MLLARNCKRAGWPLWRAALLAGSFGSCLALGGCRRTAPEKPLAEDGFARGDRVVVEQAAAQFFEGRVLSAETDHLRVQVVGGNDSTKVAPSDVYRLPPRAARELSPNLLAICGRAEGWEPCRVTQVFGERVQANSARGGSFEIGRERVLVPSALTELNLRRYFARADRERSFAESARRAGEPRPEPNWHPALHERLLVKLGPEWFTGYVRELGEDRAEVAFGTQQRGESVALSALAAEPPSSFVSELRHGDFVLIRPDTPSEPWQRCQVQSLNDKQLVLRDAAGASRAASLREVVPLRP